MAAASLAVALGTVFPAWANGFGESSGWQFQSQQDRVNKGAVLDMIERKKAGFYDAMRPVYHQTYTTYIDKQFNCTVSASTSGNNGSNSASASTSSPAVSGSAATNSSADANTASSSLTQAGLTGIVSLRGVPAPAGALETGQSNTGRLDSSVIGSPTSATTGQVTAGGGLTDQVLNSRQSTSGNLSTAVNSSTACMGPLNGN